MANYQNLTEKELKFSYWFISHKILLKRILIAFFILLSLNFYSYSIYQLTNDILNMGAREKMVAEMTIDLVNFEAYRATHKPQDLEVGSISVFPLGNNRYDLVAKISGKIFLDVIIARLGRANIHLNHFFALLLEHFAEH